MIKRGSVEDNGQERQTILEEVEKLLFSIDEEEVKIQLQVKYIIRFLCHIKCLYVYLHIKISSQYF